MLDEQVFVIFSQWILQGKFRETVRFIIDRAENGGILKPDDDAGNRKSVKEILKSKHPDQKNPDPK